MEFIVRLALYSRFQEFILAEDVSSIFCLSNLNTGRYMFSWYTQEDIQRTADENFIFDISDRGRFTCS